MTTSVPARRASDIADVAGRPADLPQPLPGAGPRPGRVARAGRLIAADRRELRPSTSRSATTSGTTSACTGTPMSTCGCSAGRRRTTPAGTTTTSPPGPSRCMQGTLTEHNLAIGTPSIETEIRAGSAFSFGPEHIHRLTGRDPGSVSVHAYSPPLWRMGQYTLGASGAAPPPVGVLRRRTATAGRHGLNSVAGFRGGRYGAPAAADVPRGTAPYDRTSWTLRWPGFRRRPIRRPGPRADVHGRRAADRRVSG